MFNFLDPKLSPKIVCRSPATDSYEIENLVSENYMDKTRGFIAYSAIKPPVEIEIEFICPISICYITLNTTVGSQKCSGIEVFVKNSNLNYTSICSSVYDNPGVVFCNNRRFSKSNLPPNFNCNFHLAFFKSNTFKSFLNATGIKIVIFRTQKSVPCLSLIEVWGTTSRSCSTTTTRTINHLMIQPPQSTKSDCIDTKNEKFEIPDDFKDDLTFEIMLIPMTLPSGKTIDQSTLEKHNKSEVSFGRKPGDPFTGIKFTEKIKPILNVALKSRIDMFLLQNSHREEFFSLKRTLGKTAPSCSQEHKFKKIKISDSNGDDLDKIILTAKLCPNFISFTNQNPSVHSCCICSTQVNFLYQIPCLHLYCRSCVLEVSKVLKCSMCATVFLKNEVKKLNL